MIGDVAASNDLLLLIAPDRARRVLDRARGCLERRARTIAFVLLILIAASLLPNGIAGLTS